jgi:hypothetical protein
VLHDLSSVLGNRITFGSVRRKYIVCPSVAIGPNSDPADAIPAIVAGEPPDRHRAYKSRQKNTRPVTA